MAGRFSAASLRDSESVSVCACAIMAKHNAVIVIVSFKDFLISCHVQVTTQPRIRNNQKTGGALEDFLSGGPVVGALGSKGTKTDCSEIA